jgi:predicted ATPase/DNA-binding SARP family transcriptional activator
LEFRILGPVEVLVGGRPIALGPPKQRVVLVELLRRRRAVPRDALIAALWGDDPPKSAVGSLQVYVHGLRRALGERRIATRGSTYALDLEGAAVDADELARRLDDGRAALAEGRPADAAAAADAALQLWRGAPLADLADHGDVAGFARELEDRRLEAVELRNDAWLALGRHDLVLQQIDREIEAQPYRERLRAHQMLALYREGRQADALAAYRATRERWAEDLGLEPTRALQDLERAMLRQDSSLTAPAARPPRRTSLPAPPTPLVGRELEVAAVRALLRTARLVTLIGPGGIGKTRLALAVAAEHADESDHGALFVDLSAVFDPALVLPMVAQALDVPADAPALRAAVAAALAARPALLVLDNLEQIIDAADDVAQLLAAVPELRVLATSRAPLRLAAEHEYRVPPLPVPRATAGGAELTQNESVQLFLARARAAGQVLDASDDVAELCRALDGLPLALELAAARTKLLSPREIRERVAHDAGILATRVRDVPRRHATLADTIAWSLDLLDAPERDAFAKLGVFVGGCTADAASFAGVRLETLEQLVDHSLLQRVQRAGLPRFTMLQTVRRAALERAGADAHRRHAEWLTSLAESIEADLAGGGDTAARLDELEAELDNLRAALAWAIDADAPGLALRLISASRPLWEIRGRLREGRAWLDQVVRAAGTRHPDLRAKVLGFAGTAALRAGALDEAETRWREMLALFEQLEDAEGIARGLSDLGTAAAARGDWAESRRLLGDAAARFRELDEPKRLAVVLANLGHVAAHDGDVDAAVDVTLEALALQRELGDEQRQAISLNNLASYACDAGELAEADRRLDECAAVADRIGYREVVAHTLVTRARIALARDDPAGALAFAAEADAVFAEAGVELAGTEAERFAAVKAEARRAVKAPPSRA